jgi:hypothetical protein
MTMEVTSEGETCDGTPLELTDTARDRDRSSRNSQQFSTPDLFVLRPARRRFQGPNDCLLHVLDGDEGSST